MVISSHPSGTNIVGVGVVNWTMLMMWWARWSIWIVGCALATAVVIGNAFYQKKQFYPTVVYITKSKPSMAVSYI